MPRKNDIHGASEIDHYRKRLGKNEAKRNKSHMKAEKRRKEIAESSSYREMLLVVLAVLGVLAVVCILAFVFLYGT
ncbi:triple QxxK/R motif-containing protein-like [Dysidea avara]|uniref:triple QxxK/R motif-containing protein-like n=1 Tax=Dysidea avara TaxID=196820 RepID=UPI0033326D6B